MASSESAAATDHRGPDAETSGAAGGERDGADEKKRKAPEPPVKNKKPGWRPEEDEELRQLVDQMGTKDWDNMAKVFSFDRPAGGLRNRWFGRLAHPTVGRIEVEEVVDLGGPRQKRESKKIAKFEPGEGSQWAKPERTEEEERELQASRERKRKAREAREAAAAREAEEAAAEAELMKDVDEFGFPRGQIPAASPTEESEEESEEEEIVLKGGDWRSRAMSFLSQQDKKAVTSPVK